MLSNKEKQVMTIIYKQAINKKSILLSAQDIVKQLPEKSKIQIKDIDGIVNSLVLDDYISMVNSDKAGQAVYCISLRKKGEAFEREQKNKKKTAVWLVTRTLILAVISFAVGMILKAIFS